VDRKGSSPTLVGFRGYTTAPSAKCSSVTKALPISFRVISSSTMPLRYRRSKALVLACLSNASIRRTECRET
jgi:hypothetical protein